jgi:ribosomal protein S12 methylthiotransferase accessory factor
MYGKFLRGGKMNLSSDVKYKDELPINTIYRIKKILNSIGIKTIEINWKNSAKGFYSVSVKVKGTNLSTNGKGTTPKYALASAYGELMERLQNQSFFRLSMDLSPEALKYEGFYYAPDEKHIDIKELENSNEEWMKIQISKMKSDIDIHEILKKWKAVCYEDVPSDFTALPYVNLINNKLSYIPIKMISKMYMSNGMCAGNTIEEALVQGISEVLERAVNTEIVMDKIIPPTIPISYIKKFPRLHDMIKEIECSGNYKIIVKDCSLDKGYPVVGVIFINKTDQTYFIKFGAHPAFEIALERTLTELLQGQNVRYMLGVKEFSYEYDMVDKYNNLMGIFTTGSGYYPAELFSREFSYEFKEFKDVEQWNNKEILNHLLKLLNSRGYDVFVRDVSYLGFPSFHVIIPGLSEIDKFDDIRTIDEYAEYVKVKKMIRNIENVSDKEINKLLEHMKGRYDSGPASIHQLINLQTKNTLPWYYENIDLFIAAAYYKIKDYSNAYKAFDKFLKYVQPNPYNKSLYVYYKCVRDYMGTRMNNLEQNHGVNLLKTFYPMNMITKVMCQFGVPEHIFSRFGKMRCWNCKKCRIRESCSYDSVEEIYKKLKHSCVENPIDQEKLVDYIGL